MIFLEYLESSDLRGIEDFREFLSDVEIYNWPYLAADFKFSEFGLPKLLGTFRAYLEIKNLIFTIVPVDEDEKNANETVVKVGKEKQNISLLL